MPKILGSKKKAEQKAKEAIKKEKKMSEADQDMLELEKTPKSEKKQVPSKGKISKMAEARTTSSKASTNDDGDDKPNFHSFINKVAKQLKPEMNLNKATVEILNDIVVKLTEHVGKEGSEVAHDKKRQSLQDGDLETALFSVNEDLSEFAIAEAKIACEKADAKDQKSKETKN